MENSNISYIIRTNNYFQTLQIATFKKHIDVGNVFSRVCLCVNLIIGGGNPNGIIADLSKLVHLGMNPPSPLPTSQVLVLSSHQTGIS